MSKTPFFTLQQVTAMMEMQGQLNLELKGVTWPELGLNWERAIRAEAVELIDHVGWKWWKDKESDWDQARMEAVDILHFLLSRLLQKEITPADTVKYFSSYIATSPFLVPAKVIGITESLIESTFQSLCNTCYDMVDLFQLLDLSGDEVFKRYIGKNVLNKFRKDHGYKDGSYIKTWNGREDNEVLSDILQGWETTGDDSARFLYAVLESEYTKVIPNLS